MTAEKPEIKSWAANASERKRICDHLRKSAACGSLAER